MSGGQCHLIHLTILRRFSWPSLAYMCTRWPKARFISFFLHIYCTLSVHSCSKASPTPQKTVPDCLRREDNLKQSVRCGHSRVGRCHQDWTCSVVVVAHPGPFKATMFNFSVLDKKTTWGRAEKKLRQKNIELIFEKVNEGDQIKNIG